MSREKIDIGQGHSLWGYAYTVGGPVAGYIIEHPHRETGQECGGSVRLADTPVPDTHAEARSKPAWRQLGEWPSITLEPSVLCTACGDHGWVRDGVWVPA